MTRLKKTHHSSKYKWPAKKGETVTFRHLTPRSMVRTTNAAYQFALYHNRRFRVAKMNPTKLAVTYVANRRAA